MEAHIKQATVDFRVLMLKTVAIETGRSDKDADIRAVLENDEADYDLYGVMRSYNYDYSL